MAAPSITCDDCGVRVTYAHGFSAPSGLPSGWSTGDDGALLCVWCQRNRLSAGGDPAALIKFILLRGGRARDAAAAAHVHLSEVKAVRAQLLAGGRLPPLRTSKRLQPGAHQRALAAVRAHPECPDAEIADEADVAERTVRSARNRLGIPQMPAVPKAPPAPKPDRRAARTAERRAADVEVLRRIEPASSREFAEALGVSRPVAQRRLRKLVEAGRAAATEQQLGRGKGRCVTYRAAS